MSDNGTLVGYASTFGNRDLGGDVVDRGAYLATLARFRKSGMVTWQHDRARLVAYPTAIDEDGYGLWLEAAFHSTAEAQAARAVTAERLAAGLQMGLSIGYVLPDGGYKFVAGVRYLTRVDLLEVAIVSIPMDELAEIRNVKGAKVGPAVPLTARPGDDKEADRRQREIMVLTEIARRLGVPIPPDGQCRLTEVDVLVGQAHRLGVKV